MNPGVYVFHLTGRKSCNGQPAAMILEEIKLQLMVYSIP
jgi:hypothetical protein